MRHVVYDVADVSLWVCWAVVGLVWIVGAGLGRRERHPVARSESRDVAAIVGAAIAAGAFLAPRTLWRPLLVSSPWPRLIAVPLLLLATAGALWARVVLGAMWSSAIVTRRGHVLRTSGPYRITRHPIYTALLAMVAATALAQGIGRWAAIFAAVTLALLLKARGEERLLLEEFPQEYRAYRRRVPRLIPSLRRWVPQRQ
jgi:protein-S-isoprenylcysteine O-methyltransferase Ste14